MSIASSDLSLPQLVLTAEQAKIVLAAKGAPVELRSEQGERLGFADLIERSDYDGWTTEDIARAKARAMKLGRNYSTQQLLDMRKELYREWTPEDLHDSMLNDPESRSRQRRCWNVFEQLEAE